jgi:hypothetical protein
VVAVTKQELAAVCTALHDSLPLSDPDRHDLESPELEAAFAHLAPGYPNIDDPTWTPGGAK